MRLLMVTVPLPSGAEPNTMAPLARQIASLRALGVQVEILEIRGSPKLKYLQALPALWTHASAVDLIHAHYGFCGWLARSQPTKPVVVSFMGDDLLGTPDARGHVAPISKLYVQINRWFARTVDAVIVKSAEMAEVVAPVQAHVVPNGVDLQAFRPMERQKARALLGWPADAHIILFPGDPDTPRKGFPLAQASVSEAAARTGQPLILIPLKQVTPEHVPLLMNACDVMLMTSFIEGSPNVVKEALACNLPVISVPVGDVPDLLKDAPGYTVAPREADALAMALVDTLNNEAPVDGRAILRNKQLDLESVARKLINIYSDILEPELADKSKLPLWPVS